MEDIGKARRAKAAAYMREYRIRKRQLESEAQASKRRASKAQYDQEYYRMIRKGEAGAENGKFWNSNNIRPRDQVKGKLYFFDLLVRSLWSSLVL